MANKQDRNKRPGQPALFAGLEFALREYQPSDEQKLASIHTLTGLGLGARNLETEVLKARFSEAVQKSGHHFVVLVKDTVEGCVSYSPTGGLLVAAVSERYSTQSQALITRLQAQQRKYGGGY